MKFFACLVISCALPILAFAKNDVATFSIEEALKNPLDSSLKGFLLEDIQLSFGSGGSGEIITKKVSANRKTNGVGKSDKEACQIAFYSALKALQARAKKDGGTKVINITGFYYKKRFDSKSEFQCGIGNIVSGVTLHADIAK